MKKYAIKFVRFICREFNIKANDVFVLRNAAWQVLPKDEQVAIGKRIYL